jgi:hypothetical protein
LQLVPKKGVGEPSEAVENSLLPLDRVPRESLSRWIFGLDHSGAVFLEDFGVCFALRLSRGRARRAPFLQAVLGFAC